MPERSAKRFPSCAPGPEQGVLHALRSVPTYLLQIYRGSQVDEKDLKPDNFSCAVHLPIGRCSHLAVRKNG